MPKCFDMSEIKEGDRIHYLTAEAEKGFFEEEGIVKEDSFYTDGVMVYGEGWRQYVGKWFITKIFRDNELIWEQEEEKTE